MCDGYYRVVFITFRFVINNTRVVAGSLRRFHLFSGTRVPQSANSISRFVSSLMGRIIQR